MFLKENVLLAVAGLKSNKVRALLTMLGIIIGIGSVIAIVSIGDALTNKVNNTMSSLGANNIVVSVVPRDSQSSWDKVDDSDLLSREQIEKFQQKYANEIENVTLAAGGGSGQVKDGRLYANVSVQGVNEGYQAFKNIKISSGRFLKDRDIDQSRRVAVVSDKLIGKMFKSGVDPLGKEITLYSGDDVSTYMVVGVYKYEQTAMMGMGGTADEDITTAMYVPITVATEHLDNQNYSDFAVKAKSTVDSTAFTKTIQKYFDKLYAGNERYRCDVQNMEDMVTEVNSMMGTISIAVAAIAAIALLVGGIGVMNIMLVSVTERTREIGTRKALGARNSFIRTQFIVESIIICVVGGAIGILFGILLAAIGVHLLGAELTVSIPIIFISVGFSMAIGIFFGYYPANKAAKLDPIEALRYE